MYIKDLFKEKKPIISFEMFPPKPHLPIESVLEAADTLAHLKPDFMSVTCGAGGSGKDSKTISVASHIQNNLSTTALAHLTCVISSKTEIKETLKKLKEENIHNILALRGDFPPESNFNPEDMDYKHAIDLVREIKDFGGFCIGGACYPAGHIENESVENDLDTLKTKVDAGIDFLTSQLFFDNNTFYSFLFRAGKKNINVPIIAGVMPVTSRSQIKRMCSLSGANLTSKFKNMLDRFYDKPESLKRAGIVYATEQIIDLLSNGVTGIHIYTMNRPEIASEIGRNLKGIIENIVTSP